MSNNFQTQRGLTLPESYQKFGLESISSQYQFQLFIQKNTTNIWSQFTFGIKKEKKENLQSISKSVSYTPNSWNIKTTDGESE